MKLRKGDKVRVIAGQYKGQEGKITQVLPKEDKVVVEGVNVRKKHQKPTQANPEGGILEITKPIWASKVAIIHPEDSKKTSRIGYKVNKSGKKERVYRQASDKVIK